MKVLDFSLDSSVFREVLESSFKFAIKQNNVIYIKNIYVKTMC